jgi:hypothetical protein
MTLMSVRRVCGTELKSFFRGCIHGGPDGRRATTPTFLASYDFSRQAIEGIAQPPKVMSSRRPFAVAPQAPPFRPKW